MTCDAILSVESKSFIEKQALTNFVCFYVMYSKSKVCQIVMRGYFLTSTLTNKLFYFFSFLSTLSNFKKLGVLIL